MIFVKHIIIDRKSPISKNYELEEWSDEGSSFVRANYDNEEAYWWYRTNIKEWEEKAKSGEANLLEGVGGVEKKELEEKRKMMTSIPRFL